MQLFGENREDGAPFERHVRQRLIGEILPAPHVPGEIPYYDNSSYNDLTDL